MVGANSRFETRICTKSSSPRRRRTKPPGMSLDACGSFVGKSLFEAGRAGHRARGARARRRRTESPGRKTVVRRHHVDVGDQHVLRARRSENPHGRLHHTLAEGRVLRRRIGRCADEPALHSGHRLGEARARCARRTIQRESAADRTQPLRSFVRYRPVVGAHWREGDWIEDDLLSGRGAAHSSQSLHCR